MEIMRISSSGCTTTFFLFHCHHLHGSPKAPVPSVPSVFQFLPSAIPRAPQNILLTKHHNFFLSQPSYFYRTLSTSPFQSTSSPNTPCISYNNTFSEVSNEKSIIFFTLFNSPHSTCVLPPS